MLGRTRIGTRALVFACALFAILGLASGCQSNYASLRLTIASGTKDGVYYQLGHSLANGWASELGMPTPTVLTTAGSPANIQLLLQGKADVGFVTADSVPDPPGRLRALARIYDDYVQIVVRADMPITKLGDLAGRPVSLGPTDSQTNDVARAILTAAHVGAMAAETKNLGDSIADLRAGRIDAFFWSGGLPTASIADLAKSVPIRLLDLLTDPSDVLNTMLRRYHVYNTAVIPARAYGLPSSVTTLVVPNILMVTDTMPNDEAEALVGGLFAASHELAGVNAAALAIDIHNAIYTEPVALHPGAVAYYRSVKI